MKVLDRVVATLAGFALIVVGGGALALVGGWNGIPFVVDVVTAAREASRVEAGLIGLLVTAVGVYLLAVAWQRDEGADDIRLEAEGGDIRIALRAVETVVFEAAAEVPGVTEVAAKLRARDGQLSLDVAVYVSSDRAMPDVARDVQERVGSRIQLVTGVPVARLDVRVRGVAKSPRRQRIE